MRFRYTCNSNSKLLIRRMDERPIKLPVLLIRQATKAPSQTSRAANLDIYHNTDL